MRLVMLGEKDPALVAELLPDALGHPEAVRDPERHRLPERGEPARRVLEIRLEEALELHERLVVERHVVELLGGEPSRLEAVARGVRGKLRVVLLAGEALLLRGGDDLPVDEKTRGRVVVVGRQAEDRRHGTRTACR